MQFAEEHAAKCNFTEATCVEYNSELITRKHPKQVQVCMPAVQHSCINAVNTNYKQGSHCPA